MALDVFLTNEALADIAQLQEYLAAIDPHMADRAIAELDRVMRADIAERPAAYTWFYLTGAPSRARLFRISRRTQYWVVYDIDMPRDRIVILRTWNASRDPAAFEL
jgi:hypothetical protein